LSAIELTGHPVLTVMAIAVIASLLAEIRLGTVRIPVVVWLMLFGMAIGPGMLAIANPDLLLQWFGRAGLSALFFSAGMDLDLERVKGRPLELALGGWLLSLMLGVAIALLLHLVPFVNAPMMVALVLTTTAVGTFMPMLRDAGRLETKFGNLVLAAGAMGEFGPVVIVSLVLTRTHSAWWAIGLMVAYVAIAIGAAIVAVKYRPPRVLALFSRTMHSSTQLPICFSVLLLSIFVVLSQTIGLEAVLGAFAAGMIIGLAIRGEPGALFREKMDAIGFGLFIPFFFVVSGMSLDVGALLHNSETIALIPLFLASFVVVRGLPVFLYRKDLAKNERWPFVLYSATALPMVVAISEIGVRMGRMRPSIAAALVGAGLISVLLFPAIAEALLARDSLPKPSLTASKNEAMS
jgi:Kef-type K+ transport system membrane component KefB